MPLRFGHVYHCQSIYILPPPVSFIYITLMTIEASYPPSRTRGKLYSYLPCVSTPSHSCPDCALRCFLRILPFNSSLISPPCDFIPSAASLKEKRRCLVHLHRHFRVPASAPPLFSPTLGPKFPLNTRLVPGATFSFFSP